MGGSAIGGALARAALGDTRLAADPGRARLRPAAVDDARHDRAVRVLLGRHRGDAGLPTRPRARWARRASWPPAAASWPSWRAPTACRSSRSPAGCSRAPPSPTSRSPRWRSPRAAAPGRAARRTSTSPPSTSRSSSIEWGPEAAEDSEAKALARGLVGDGPGDLRRGPDDADRLPLEDAAQRERQDPGVLARAARARPQRARRLGGRGGARRASARSSSRTATRIRASPTASS